MGCHTAFTVFYGWRKGGVERRGGLRICEMPRCSDWRSGTPLQSSMRSRRYAIALRRLTGTSQCVSGIIRNPDALRIACLGVGRCDTRLHHRMRKLRSDVPTVWSCRARETLPRLRRGLDTSRAPGLALVFQLGNRTPWFQLTPNTIFDSCENWEDRKQKLRKFGWNRAERRTGGD